MDAIRCWSTQVLGVVWLNLTDTIDILIEDGDPLILIPR